MGIEIQGGQGVFYQWDTGRKLAVDDGAEQVHFQNREHGTTIDVNVVDGVAAVPDILLQAARPLRVFAYIEEADGCYTKLERVFEVTERNKPAGYVYSPTEARNFSQLQKQIGNLTDLGTTAKSDLVAAVNEVNEKAVDIQPVASSVIREVTDDNFSEFDDLEKWFNADDGVYILKTSRRSNSLLPPISAKFHYLNITDPEGNNVNVDSGDLYPASNSLVLVTMTDDSGGGRPTTKHVFFSHIEADGQGSGQLYKQFYDFTLKTGRGASYNSSNVELQDVSRAGALVPDLFSFVQQIAALFGSIDFENDAGKLVGISADGFIAVDPATIKG